MKPAASRLFCAHVQHDEARPMLPNQDRFSRPSQGRFFPLTPAKLLHVIKDLGFKHSEYRRRIDLELRNPRSRHEHGTLIASFYPSEALHAYSVSDDMLPQRAETLLMAAVLEFHCIDAQVDFFWNRRNVASYRLYLAENNHLRLTHRVRSAKLAKYRGGAKFSNAFKPKGVSTAEDVLREIAVS